MRLHVITPLFNPGGFDAIPRNVGRFWARWPTRDPVTLVEAAFGDEQHADISAGMPNVDHVRVRTSSTLWIKENLGNIGASRLPDDAEAILWLDGDVEFLRQDWIGAVEHALQHHAVVQPWSECVRTGPQGEFLGTTSRSRRSTSAASPGRGTRRDTAPSGTPATPGRFGGLRGTRWAA